MPASASSRAVPPVETISIPSSASPRANSTIPVLSETDSSARRTRGPMSAADRDRGRHGLDVGFHRRELYRSMTTRRGLPGSTLTAPRAIRPTASGEQLVLHRVQAAQHLTGILGLRQLDRALEDDRPGVDPAVDEVDRHPEHLDPVVERLLDGPQARKRRQQRRMDVDDPIRERRQELGAEQLHVAGQHDELHAGSSAATSAIAGVPVRAVGERLAGKRPRGDSRLAGAGSARASGWSEATATRRTPSRP